MAFAATPSSTSDLLAFTAQIVAAHAAGNQVPAHALPALIRSVHDALAQTSIAAPEAQKPAVPIKRSIHPDYLVCLEDGAHVQVLTRYLRRFGLTPDMYRAKWGLPRDYPMVSSASAAKGSLPAKSPGNEVAATPAEQSTPKAQVQAEPPTVPVEPETQHTAASVFANFPGGDVPVEAPPAANDAEKPGRKRFAQQFMREGRRRA